MYLTCIGDVHLKCYTNHEFYPGFRDEQFIRAAKRVIEISKSVDSKNLCILGDLIEQPVNTPNTVHLMVQFMELLNEYYDNIYYILGQHDVDSKDIDWREKDTIVTLLSKISSKIKYVNKMTIPIGGRAIYFRDWTKREIIDDVPDCDIFLGHVTLSDNPKLFKGQEIKPDNFKLGVFGDIHKPVDIGKLHSLGGFLQKNLNDDPYGNVVLINLDDCNFKRVRLINKDNKFLRIYKEGTEVDPDEYTVVISNNGKLEKIELRNDDGTSIKEVSINQLDTVVTEKLTKYDLSDVHKEVYPKCKISDPIDFDFKLHKLIVDNFRSIKHYELNLDKYNGILFISGKNGSGKTSLINALYTSLVGDRYIKRDTRTGSTEPIRLEVDFDYHGINYRIVRGAGLTEFFEDGKKISKNNKTALDNYIVEKLPFIPYLNVFYVRAKSNYFTNLFQSKLINKLFGIDNFVQYFNVAERCVKDMTKEFNSNNEFISNLKGKIEIYKKTLEEKEAKLEELKSNFDASDEEKLEVINQITTLRSSIEYNKRQLASYADLADDEKEYESLKDCKTEYDEARKVNEKIDSLENNLNKMKSELARLNKPATNVVVCPKCGFEIVDKIPAIEERKEYLAEEIKKLEAELEPMNSIDLKPLRDKVNRLNELESIRIKIQKKAVLKDTIAKQESDLEKLVLRDALYVNTSDFLMNWKSEYISKKNNIRSLSNDIVTLKGDINKLEIDLENAITNNDNLKIKIDKYKLYSELFNESSPNSIHKEVIARISESLSDEDISFINQNTCEEDNLGLQLKVGDNWIDYSRCSTGQQSYLDLKLITKLFSLINNSGLLILDEVVANIDQENLEPCIELVRNINCQHLLMISHNAVLSNDFDAKLECKLVNNCSEFS